MNERNETIVFFVTSKFSKLINSHKKRKDSLEGSLDLVLFAAECQVPKILIQNTSSVNIECAGKSKRKYSFS